MGKQPPTARAGRELTSLLVSSLVNLEEVLQINSQRILLLPHHSCWCSRKEILGALSLVTTMLDGHTQMVLGDVPGDLSPSRLASAFDHHQRQAFCGDSEGWGPLSLNGFYFTSCFVDAVVAVVAVWGSLAGLAALWLLLKKRVPQPVAKNWHFYAKLVRRPHSPPNSRIPHNSNQV